MISTQENVTIALIVSRWDWNNSNKARLYAILFYLFRGNCLLIPASALYGNAALRGIVNIDEAEAFRIAFGPLEVIQQRPDKIARQRCPFLDGFACLSDIFLQVIHAAGIMHLS